MLALDLSLFACANSRRADTYTRKSKINMANKEKPRAKKIGIKVRDLAPRKDAKAGATAPVKSSPVALPIPPQGFIASSENPNAG